MTVVQCLYRLIPIGSRALQRPQVARFVRGVHVDRRTHLGMAYIVGHDKENHEFYIRLQEDDGQKSTEKAMLQYEFVRKDLIDMYHTFVPDVFRGKGIAKLLAKEAMDHAVKEDLKMRLSCTYLQKYVKDNPLPQYTERVVS